MYNLIVYKLTLYQRFVEKKPDYGLLLNVPEANLYIKKKTITHINILVEDRKKNRFRKSYCQNNVVLF